MYNVLRALAGILAITTYVGCPMYSSTARPVSRFPDSDGGRPLAIAVETQWAYDDSLPLSDKKPVFRSYLAIALQRSPFFVFEATPKDADYILSVEVQENRCGSSALVAASVFTLGVVPAFDAWVWTIEARLRDRDGQALGSVFRAETEKDIYFNTASVILWPFVPEWRQSRQDQATWSPVVNDLVLWVHEQMAQRS